MLGQILVNKTDDDDRHYASNEEMQILRPNLRLYFSYPERSISRKELVDKVLEELKKKNAEHWDAKKVRVWFNNNKKAALSVDPERIPTAQIPPIPMGDPNQMLTGDISDNKANLGQKNNSRAQTNGNIGPQEIQIPPIPELSVEIASDQNSYQSVLQKHYEYLNTIRKLSQENVSINTLKTLASNFNQCINQMIKKLNVESIFSFDTMAKKVYAFPTKQFLTNFSESLTSISSSGQYPQISECKMDKITDHIQRKQDLAVPVGNIPNYSKFYQRSVSENIQDIPGIICSTFMDEGELIYTFYAQNSKCYSLSINGNVIPIPCYQAPTSIVYDSDMKIVWIAAECRIFGISVESLSLVDILFASAHPLEYTSISIIDGNLYLTTQSSIVIYKKNAQNQQPFSSIVTELNPVSYQNKIIPEDLDQSIINKKRGRNHMNTFTPSCRNYNFTTSIDKSIIVSSSVSNQIDVLNSDRQQVGLLVGHTGSTTALSTYKDLLFSGSADFTMKAWDVKKNSCAMHFDRHTKKITAIHACEVDERLVVFSGGDDGVIRAWDPQNSTEIFEFCREKTSIRKIHFIPESMTLLAVIRDESEILLPGQPVKSQLLTISFNLD